MVYLVLCVVCSACFGLCYKVSTRRGYHAPLVQLAMFTACALVSALLASCNGGLLLNLRVGITGFWSGVFMAVAIYTFFVAMRQGGLAVGWTCVNFSVVVPLAASVLFWHEVPSLRQVVGLALLVPCILLFANLHLQVTGDRRRWALLIVVSSLLSGASSVMAKIANELPQHLPPGAATPGQTILSYLAFAYATAALILFLSMRRKHIRVRSFDAVFGLAMGMLGLVATWTLIRSLDFLPGIVVFPVKSAGGLVLTAIAAVVVWQERLTKRQTCGIAIGALSTVLINW